MCCQIGFSKGSTDRAKASPFSRRFESEREAKIWLKDNNYYPAEAHGVHHKYKNCSCRRNFCNCPRAEIIQVR